MLSAVTQRSQFNAMLPWASRLIALLIVVILVGLMPEIAGIDPSQTILRARSGQQQLLTPEALAAVRADLELDRSTSERLWSWASSAIQGDLGASWIDGSSVMDAVKNTAMTSLTLTTTALALTVVLCGISVCYTFWRWKTSRLGVEHNAVSSVLVALPEYVIAAVLILVFSVWLGVFPPYGWKGIENLWLPAFSLALPASGLFSRLLNDSLKRVLSEPWVITWLSANVQTRKVARFALWRAISNLFPQIAMTVIGLTGGAVAVEQIFSIPGIGRLILGATKAQDLPMVQGGLLVLLLFSILVSSLGILLQKVVLGHSLQSGKLVSSHSSFNFTRSKLKRSLSVMIFTSLAIVVWWASQRDATTSQFARLAAASFDAPMGADGIGRDLLARVGQGMIATIKAGAFATLLSLIVGLAMGFCTRFSQGFIEITKGVPYIIAGLLVAGLTGMNPNSALIAIVLVSWAPLAAHCSSLLVEAKAQPYTHLAPTWGTQRWRMLRYYLLPYVLPPLLRHALLRLPVITLSLTSLSFIGLGAKPPTPEWGLLIAENMPYIERSPQGVLIPIMGLVLIGVAINLLFDD
ncbi:ABC transporter permease subunit [Vibrio agarivorans]|uniref:ABC transporter permease subunit n=1 Tax=Vibrio agarivorans TaxID=153622 RepID=A0ABT7XZZ7_9VIBR|nr:ABC transporter permease subunit [Vibrio agarivorans]MDN2481359.1 ABC transporter permease subunit [Vibrio agarivorans]